SRGGDAAHSVRDIFAAAEDGNPAAQDALDAAAYHTARAALAMLALLDPDLLIFGGSIGSRPEFIERVERLVSQTWLRPIQIVRSRSGGRAGLLGALELARSDLLDELFGTLPTR
ncbi:MAG TPA: ROK family protein, partial [Devosia sp.]|nr:ROK family protein [Devosia sp.]